MSDYLFEETPEEQMRSLAHLLGTLAESGLTLTPEEIDAVSGYVRRRAEAAVLSRLIRRARRGRPLPPDLLAVWDQWAAGYVGAPPQIGAGQGR